MKKEHLERNSGWNRSNSPRHQFSIKEFDGEIHLINQLGEVYTVPPDGSLALLSLGALGTRAWRLSKHKHGK